MSDSARWLRHFLSGGLWGCLIMGAMAFAAEQPESWPVSDYHAGVQAYHAGAFEKAAALFHQALGQNHGSATNAHYYLGLSLERLGEPNRAAAEYAYVIAHGQEAGIVAYAQARFQQLHGTLFPPAGIAMIASGSPIVPAVFHGSVSQVAVPLKSNKNALMVDAAINQGSRQATGAFIIDTGATYTSISEEMARQLGLDLQNCEKIYITTANGRIEVPKVTLETLNVNGLQASRVEATVIPVRQGASFSGLLGLSFIRQFVLTIDPQSNQLIFRRN